MSHKPLDRAKEYTSTQGLGAFTLAGPVAGCISICDSTQGLIYDGDTTWLCAENGTEWEVFLATRTNSTTIARSGTITSSNGGNPVNFTAPPVLFGTVPAAKISSVGNSCRAYLTSAQTVSSMTWTKVNLNAASFDPDAILNTSNGRITPKVAGYYKVDALLSGNSSNSTMIDLSINIYKNGSKYTDGQYTPSANMAFRRTVTSDLVYMNGTTDYLELYAYVNGGGTLTLASGESETRFTVSLAALPGQAMLAPVTAPGPGVSSYRSGTNQSVSTATWTKVQLNGEAFDIGNCFDSTTNYRFQPNVAGYYQVSFAVYTQVASGGTATQAAILKNGVYVAQGTYAQPALSLAGESVGSKLIYMNGTTDYLELWGYASGTSPVFLAGESVTFMTAQLAAVPNVPIPTTGPMFSAYLTADQSIPSATFTKVQLNAEEFDTHNCFDTANYRFTPNVAGYYRISWIVRVTVLSAGLTIFLGSLYKNGTEFKRVQQTMTSGGASLLEGTAAGSCLVYMNGTTDYLELYGYGYGNQPKINGTTVYTTLSGEFVRA